MNGGVWESWLEMPWSGSSCTLKHKGHSNRLWAPLTNLARHLEQAVFSQLSAAIILGKCVRLSYRFWQSGQLRSASNDDCGTNISAFSSFLFSFSGVRKNPISATWKYFYKKPQTLLAECSLSFSVLARFKDGSSSDVLVVAEANLSVGTILLRTLFTSVVFCWLKNFRLLFVVEPAERTASEFEFKFTMLLFMSTFFGVFDLELFKKEIFQFHFPQTFNSKQITWMLPARRFFYYSYFFCSTKLRHRDNQANAAPFYGAAIDASDWKDKFRTGQLSQDAAWHIWTNVFEICMRLSYGSDHRDIVLFGADQSFRQLYKSISIPK